MPKIIMESTYRCTIIAIDKGEAFYAKFCIPDNIAHLVNIRVSESGSIKITAKTDLILIAENLHPSKRGCAKVRFMRAQRPEMPLERLKIATCENWPRLKTALVRAQVPKHDIIGDFENVIIYDDEVAIPGSQNSSPNGWIIERRDIYKYLDSLPRLRDARQIQTLAIDHNGQVYLKISLDKILPIINVGGPVFLGNPCLKCHLPENEQLLVTFDLGSKIIKQITGPTSDEEYLNIHFGKKPKIANLYRDKRLPPSIINATLNVF